MSWKPGVMPPDGGDFNTLEASPDTEEDIPLPIEVPKDKEHLDILNTDPVVKVLPSKWELTEGVDYEKAGWWGQGAPTRTFKSSTKHGRDLQDGGGLCSPGRWQVRHRVLPPEGELLKNILDQWIDCKAGVDGEAYIERIVFKCMTGNMNEDPFEGQVSVIKNALALRFAELGFTRPAGQWRKGQDVDYGFLHMLGRWLQDPDFGCMAEFCNGVRLGVGVELPRTPKVWP